MGTDKKRTKMKPFRELTEEERQCETARAAYIVYCHWTEVDAIREAVTAFPHSVGLPDMAGGEDYDDALDGMYRYVRKLQPAGVKRRDTVELFGETVYADALTGAAEIALVLAEASLCKVFVECAVGEALPKRY